ncbi:MAG: hypothetical protein HY231_17000 [Acidobacteria bacterium]|nr:hypothetical protein [Acidobacteriota bacterium]
MKRLKNEAQDLYAESDQRARSGIWFPRQLILKTLQAQFMLLEKIEVRKCIAQVAERKIKTA